MANNNLCDQFDSKRMENTIGARVADVAAGQQFTAIADTGHDYVEVHEVVSSYAFMQGLSCGGVKNLYLESMDSLTEGVFQSYRDGKISDKNLQIIGQEFFKSSGEVDFDLDPVRARQTMIDYMKNAKLLGIELGAVSLGEGMFTEKEYKDLNEVTHVLTEQLLKIVEEDPKFKETVLEGRIDYLKEALQSNFQDDLVLRDVLTRYNGVILERQARIEREVGVYQEEGLSRVDAYKKVGIDMLVARLDKDDEVADRVELKAGDEKAAIVYGSAHFLRRFGDIDSTLGNIATIAVYGDRDAQELDRPPKSTTGLDWFYHENPDYKLDAAEGTWQKEGGAVVKLDRPDGVVTEDINPELVIEQPKSGALVPGVMGGE